MNVAELLEKLEKVKRTGAGRWVASCPSHSDRSPSLNVKECTDGRILMICRAGCHTHDIVHSIGLELRDLFPSDERRLPLEKRPFSSADVFRALADEVLLISVASSDLCRGKALNEADHARLLLAVGRVKAAVKEGGFVL